MVDKSSSAAASLIAALTELYLFQPSQEGGKGGGKGGKGKGKGKGGTSGPSSISKIVKMIVERNYDPVIIFAFSKKDCEALAQQVSRAFVVTN